jgi:hypothetical protein
MSVQPETALIAKAFSNAVPDKWHTPDPMPNGLNWSVRLDGGVRQIACWRTLDRQILEFEVLAVAKHSGFADVRLEPTTNQRTGITAIYITEVIAAAPKAEFGVVERVRLIEMLVQAAQHSGGAERRAYLETLSDKALIAEAQQYTGGSIWRKFQGAM